MVKLYCALVRPIMEYAAPVWCPSSVSDQGSLERVQRRFTRCCLGLPRKQISILNKNNIEYSERCTRLGLPFMMNRLYFRSISFIAKCLYLKFDLPILNFISINARHSDTLKFCHVHSRTNAFHQSLYVKFPRMWDSLDPDTRNSLLFSLTSFLARLRKFYVNCHHS